MILTIRTEVPLNFLKQHPFIKTIFEDQVSVSSSFGRWQMYPIDHITACFMQVVCSKQHAMHREAWVLPRVLLLQE